MRELFPFLIIAWAFVPSLARADLSSTIERIKPSIVIVGKYLKTDSPPMKLRGTGFVVSDGNLVVTNSHVISSGREDTDGSELVVQTGTKSGEQQIRKARVISNDILHDLALLHIEGVALPALKVGNSELVREGQSVAFIGFPIGSALGFSPVTHRGIVSAITSIAPPSPNARILNERLIRSVKRGTFHVFQLDATAYPGNSGGPLFDPVTGEVLGILNMVFVKGVKESALSQPSGISYAIPAKHLIELIGKNIEQKNAP